MKKQWFTLVELLIVMVIISVWLIAVIEGITRSMALLRKTSNEVVAINLAREGMEAVYNIRNTNRLRRSWKRDWCRLSSDPSSCGAFMWSGHYIVSHDNKMRKMTSQTQSFESWGDPREIYRLCNEWWKYTHEANCSDDDKSPFYRVIIGKWLYNKKTWAGMNCDGTETSWPCVDDTPKEYRFCSRVVNPTWIKSDVQMCGLMTNFVE